MLATTTRRANVDIYCDINPVIRSEILLRDIFDFMLTHEDVTAIKPDPAVYLKALAGLGLAANDCLVIEVCRALRQPRPRDSRWLLLRSRIRRLMKN